MGAIKRKTGGAGSGTRQSALPTKTSDRGRGGAKADTGTSPAEAALAARQAGLRYVSDDEPGFSRRKSAKGFDFYDQAGKRIRDPQIVDRLRKLAVPPAYEDVWFCADADGHIQATGRDARGRKQYRYHPEWIALRDEDKYGRMVAFGAMLPKLRARIETHLRRPNLGRRKVLAAVVRLLDTTLIRVGNEDYARANKSYGLTTLRDRHVAIGREEMRFEFKGKSGKIWRLELKDRRLARIVRECQDLPGQHLFQYVDAKGARHSVTSTDVNAYLREISGAEVTAKDFRTWAGTVLAAMALREFESFDSAAKAKKNVKAAIERVAARLGNTPTICRKCYVHPHILETYLDGRLVEEVRALVDRELKTRLPRLQPEEAAVLALLRRRLAAESRARRASPTRARTTPRKKPPALREQLAKSLRA